jgi:undecaprenyl-diphosphatase
MGSNPESGLLFTVAVHGATVLSTLVVFRDDITRLVSGVFKFRRNEETEYAAKILISMIPVGIAGVFFKDEVEALFTGKVSVIGLMLIVTAVLLFAGHFVKSKQRKIGFADAFIIGIAQAVAVIPGISRSGATISTGLMLGNKKEDLARFSFLMVIIPVLGANLLEIASGDFVNTGSESPLIILTGFVTAFISGYFACRWMISLVKRSRMIWFGLYCLAVGLITFILG